MSVDFTGWKSGDEFEAVIKGYFHHIDHDGDVWVNVTSDSVTGGDVYIIPALIKSITRIDLPIKVGDRVTKNKKPGTVTAVGRRHVLVDFDYGYEDAVYPSVLERIA